VTKPSNISDFISELDASAANQIILSDISVTTATPELPSPLLTASGALKNASLVLVTMTSKCGIEGHSYLFSPNAKLLPALASAVSVAFEEVKGRSCSPEMNTDYLLDKFKLFGGTGILTMAFAAGRYGFLGFTCSCAEKATVSSLGRYKDAHTFLTKVQV
jgi:hypothetical protein